MNDNMKTSKNGLEFIMKWEGCLLKPYKDVGGLRTIGVGHLIKPNEDFPDGVAITKERALEILAKDVELCEKAIKKDITVPLNQNQFDALVSFGFNCGYGIYARSNVGKAINASEFEKVPGCLMDWNRARINGLLQEVKGLTNRRKSEGELFSTPVEGTILSEFILPWTKDSLIDAQTKLQKLGLYTLKIDGIWGPGSKKAVVEFSEQIGMSLVDPQRGVPQKFFTELTIKAS